MIMNDCKKQVLACIVGSVLDGKDVIFMEDGNKSHRLQNYNIQSFKASLRINCMMG